MTPVDGDDEMEAVGSLKLECMGWILLAVDSDMIHLIQVDEICSSGEGRPRKMRTRMRMFKRLMVRLMDLLSKVGFFSNLLRYKADLGRHLWQLKLKKTHVHELHPLSP